MFIAQLLLPFSTFGHEVYVLNSRQITHDQHDQTVDVWHVLQASHDLHIFLLYGLAMVLLLGLYVYLKSLSPFQKLGRFIDKATPIAPDIIRVAFGVSLLFSLKNQALFGPELPLSSFPVGQLIKPMLLVSGVALVLGIGIRWFGIITAGLWLFAFACKGWYMLTYLNYLGEALAVILLSQQTISLDRLFYQKKKIKIKPSRYQRYSMPIARILFALALGYTAITIKFMHSALSLDVVNSYHLTRYFHFDPLFIVLGAGLIELLVATLYLLGLLQRVTTIVFLVFLGLSLSFFHESVWPHYLLIALGVGIFLHKPDDLALDAHLFASQTPRKNK